MSEKPRPLILTIHNVGSVELDRHVISDQYLRYYTGSSWDLDIKKALLYHDGNEACDAVHQLLMTEFVGTPVRKFHSLVQIELFAGGAVTIAELQQWLVDIAKLVMDSPKLGNGPFQGTLGLVSINWDLLEEVQEDGQRS